MIRARLAGFEPPAADALAARPDQALARAQAAARRLRERDLTTQQFAAQHVRITRDLLTRRRAHAAAEAALSFAGSRSRSNG